MSKEDNGIFSPGERLIISMLCELFQSQKIKSEFNIDLIKAALGSDEWALRSEYSSLMKPDIPSDKIVSETYDILSMWENLERVFAELPEDAKRRVLEGAEWIGADVHLSGFDGNNEDHHGIAYFIINHLKRFASLSKYALNAHMPTIDMHRRILNVYTPIIRRGGINEGQLIEILRERIHPENRGQC
jgi:uncharacterized protein YfbU (UPF0304 family)